MARQAPRDRWDCLATGVPFWYDTYEATRSALHPMRTSSQKKKVLIVTSAFPPSIGPGAHRIASFVKYLPQWGWEPHVLTESLGPYRAIASSPESVANEAYPHVIRTPFFDIRFAGRKLLSGATKKKISQTASMPELSKITAPRLGNLVWTLANTFVFVPDPDIGWFPFGVRAGLSAIKRREIDVILSSAPPFTAHLIALRLKRLTGKPWVADFRDPWSQNPSLVEMPFWAIRKPVDRFLERRVMKNADAVIGVSGPMVENFARLRVKGIERKLYAITNGYDPDDFAAASPSPAPTFTVTYTGTFAGEAGSPAPFLTALAELIEQGILPRDRIRVRIIETYAQQTGHLAQKLGLSDVVSVQVGLSHCDTIREQMSASVLLLIVRGDSLGLGVYTGKVFEYLGARRRILALVPKRGVAAQLIREADAGTVVDPANRQEIKEAILNFYLEHQTKGVVAYHGADGVIRRFERPLLTGQLAAILDGVLSTGADKSPRPA